MAHLKLVETLADTGATLAASHADREIDDWTDQAIKIFQLFSMRCKEDGETFMTEQVRAWAEKCGLPPPPDNRAWGYVARQCARKGWVKAKGFGKQESVSCHGSPKTIWEAA